MSVLRTLVFLALTLPIAVFAETEPPVTRTLSILDTQDDVSPKTAPTPKQTPRKTRKATPKPAYDEGAFYQLGTLPIRLFDYRVVLEVDDPMIRHFSIKESGKIVLDFEPVRYLRGRWQPESHRITRIDTASHENYNRVSITIAPFSEYEVHLREGQWMIEFK